MGFEKEVQERLDKNGGNPELKQCARAFMDASLACQYSYNFSWLGRPVIQYPQDIVAMQGLIWRVQPTLIIETGIAHGGSLIFSASMLELLAACGGNHEAYVLGIDVDIRSHNRRAIESHPLARRIKMVEGSSIAAEVIEQVYTHARTQQRVLICLDANHTHAHVLAELAAYAPLVTVGSYCVVFDTIIEASAEALFPGRSWGQGNNPHTAVQEYLKTHPEFEVDRDVDHCLMLSAAPGGYLKRVS